MANLFLACLGLRACSRREAEAAQFNYYANLILTVVNIAITGWEGFAMGAEPGVWVSFILVILPPLYFVWVTFSFYARLEVGQLSLCTDGPQYVHYAPIPASKPQQGRGYPANAHKVQQHQQQYQGYSGQGQYNQGQSYQGQNYQGQNYQGQTDQNQSHYGQSYQDQNYQGQNYQGRNYKGQYHQGQANQGQNFQSQNGQNQYNQGQAQGYQPRNNQGYTYQDPSAPRNSDGKL
eukprot:CAMPEP_0115013436 /NCGR_PEP_ID=MMETSP0216-20121206/25410_1 /TAXON_ID=223996 /ORGANISM="Protocruzia adherens, Strain Boccale" /LENGTH=233 /DNA_ID=CAMNT_0002382841 /DNA_START=213 /DNA_END=914 /DNA_ORIENTATION=-